MHFQGKSPQVETLEKFLFLLLITIMEHSCLIRDFAAPCRGLWNYSSVSRTTERA